MRRLSLSSLGGSGQAGEYRGGERGDGRAGFLDEVRHEVVVEAEQSKQEVARNDLVLVQLVGGPKRQL
jgi:hypothetical protein